MTDIERSIQIMQAAGHDWVPMKISTARKLMMAANLKKTVKIDEKDGKKRVVRVRKFDASKARRIAKSKSKRVVAPAKARAAR